MNIKNRDDDYLRAFGMHVRRLRESKGLTQYRLAINMGVDRTHLSAIENGTSEPSLSYIKRLADTFEIDVKELFNF